MDPRSRGRAFLFAVAMAVAMVTASPGARAGGPLAPENAQATHDNLLMRCIIVYLCPYAEEIWRTLGKAITGTQGDEYMLGIYLMTGDKVGIDSVGGTAWLGLAAAQGYAPAALELNRQRRGGAEMTVDEPAIAQAMRRQADAGSTEAMRALAILCIDGRGVARDPAEALRLFRRAADAGSKGLSQSNRIERKESGAG